MNYPVRVLGTELGFSAGAVCMILTVGLSLEPSGKLCFGYFGPSGLTKTKKLLDDTETFLEILTLIMGKIIFFLFMRIIYIFKLKYFLTAALNLSWFTV